MAAPAGLVDCYPGSEFLVQARFSVGMLRVRMRFLVLILTLCAFAGVASFETTLAGEHDRARSGVLSGQHKSLGQILPGIRQRFPGRLLDARLVGSPNSYTYRLKWLGQGGRVMWISVDARSGRIIGVQEGRFRSQLRREDDSAIADRRG